jgi:hypothetical protein
MRGLDTFSAILGIKQKQQALQTGQYLQQTAQAESQQAQQKNTELSNLAAYTQNAIQSGKYIKDNGDPDVEAFQAGASQVAPVYGAENIGRMTENFRSAIGTRRDLQSLTDDQNKQLGGIATSIASMDNPSRDDVLDVVGQARTNNRDRGFNRALDNLIMNMPPGMSPADIKKSAGNLASGLTGVSQAQGGTNAAGQNISINPFTREQKLAKGPNPSTPQVAAQTTAQTGTSEEDVHAYTKALTQGANSKSIGDLARQIKSDVAQARTGQYTQEFANRLTVFQQHNPGATAVQMLQKDAANLKSMAEQGTTTDAERSQIGHGLPSPETMGPDALIKAANYWEGFSNMTGGRRDVAVQHYKQNGSAQGYAAKDAAYMSKASPIAMQPQEPAKKANRKPLSDFNK